MLQAHFEYILDEFQNLIEIFDLSFSRLFLKALLELINSPLVHFFVSFLLHTKNEKYNEMEQILQINLLVREYISTK